MRSVCSSKQRFEMSGTLEVGLPEEYGNSAGGWAYTSPISDCLKQLLKCGTLSCWIGGAPLEEEGVAGVTHSDWFGGRRQRKLIVRAAVTENLPAVPTVVLEKERRQNQG